MSGLPEVCFADTKVCGLNNGATSIPTPSPTTGAPVILVTLPPVPPSPADLCIPEKRMAVNLGYYESWATYRAPGCNNLQPDGIDVEGMGYTHLVYAFAAVGENWEIEAYNGENSEEFPKIQRMNSLKEIHPQLVTLIGVGGWTHNDPGRYCNRFRDVSATPERRQIFADSVLNFCRTVSFRRRHAACQPHAIICSRYALNYIFAATFPPFPAWI